MADCYDVAIIGGGVVGCAVARACALAGRRCVLIEREAALAASHASGGNTGIACTANDCEEGTVEHACLERAAELNRDAYDACNVPYAATGAVYVAYGAEEEEALDRLAEAHCAAADVLASGAAVEARCRLPGLAARGATRGLHVRREITVEPWCVPVAWALHARANGAELLLGQEVIGAAFDQQLWTLELRQRRGERAGAASALRARVLVNCGGLYADAVDATLRAGRSTFAVAPRRGDYVILDARGPLASLGALARPVGGVPLGELGRGAYAWRTVHGDVIVGPTAEPYSERTVPADDHSSKAEATLLRAAKRALGVSSFDNIRGRYVGLRPGAKDQSDYIVRRDGARVTVAGIRSTGLTASLAIGERALALVEEVLPRCAVPAPRGFALPSLDELRASYEGDTSAGTVLISGERVAVTHPQTRFGLCRAVVPKAPRLQRHVNSAEAARSLVEELRGHAPTSVERIVGGRTNDMFRVVDDEGVSVLVRVYGGGADLGIDRVLEGATFEAAGRHLGRPRCLGHFANGRMEEYLEGHRNTTYEDVSNPTVYREIARAVATLHTFVPPPELCGPGGHDLDAPGLWPTLRGWLAASATDATATAISRDADDAKLWSESACFRDFDAFGAVIDAAEVRLAGDDLDASLVFAHNDLTLDNVMVGPDGTVRLVDLERAPVSLSFSMDTTRNKAGRRRRREAGRFRNGWEIDMSVSELGPYHARSGIDRFLHPRRYGGPNYAAFDVANHFWEWCGGLDDSATPRFERYPAEATRRAWIEALLQARAAATSGDGCGSGVVEPAAVDRFCRAIDIFAPLDHLFWGLWAVTQAAALGRSTGFRYLLYASHRLSHPSVAEAVGRAS